MIDELARPRPRARASEDAINKAKEVTRGLSTIAFGFTYRPESTPKTRAITSPPTPERRAPRGSPVLGRKRESGRLESTTGMDEPFGQTKRMGGDGDLGYGQVGHGDGHGDDEGVGIPPSLGPRLVAAVTTPGKPVKMSHVGTEKSAEGPDGGESVGHRGSLRAHSTIQHGAKPPGREFDADREFDAAPASTGTSRNPPPCTIEKRAGAEPDGSVFEVPQRVWGGEAEEKSPLGQSKRELECCGAVNQPQEPVVPAEEWLSEEAETASTALQVCVDQ